MHQKFKTTLTYTYNLLQIQKKLICKIMFHKSLKILYPRITLDAEYGRSPDLFYVTLPSQ